MTSQGPVSFGLPEEGSPPRSFDDNDADQDKQRIAVLSSIATFLEKRPRTKVIIRRLAPQTSPIDLISAIRDACARLPHEISSQILSSVMWMQLVPGLKRDTREYSAAVANLLFACPLSALAFINAFQGHTFIYNNGSSHKSCCGLSVLQRNFVPVTAQPGHESFLSVEGHTAGHALEYYESHPMMLLSVSYVEPHKKAGTIFTDPSYLEFVDDLNAPKAAKKDLSGNPASPPIETNIISPVVKVAMERRIQRTQRQNSKNRKASELSAENRGRQWASSHPKPAAIPKLPKENTRYADREATNRTAAQKSSARSRSNREPSKAVDQEKTGSEKASRLGDKSSDISDHTPSPQVVGKSSRSPSSPSSKESFSEKLHAVSSRRSVMISSVKHVLSGLKDGEMDFDGQKLAARIMIQGMLGAATLATIAGVVTRSFDLMVQIVTGAAICVGLICVPSWPIYRRNLLLWRISGKEAETLLKEEQEEDSGSEDSDSE